jgi:hypothetical protein
MVTAELQSASKRRTQQVGFPAHLPATAHALSTRAGWREHPRTHTHITWQEEESKALRNQMQY